MSFDLTHLLIASFFGLVGFSAWRYGRLSLSGRHMILGVLLMGYGFLIPNPLWSILIGSVLTALLFWP